MNFAYTDFKAGCKALLPYTSSFLIKIEIENIHRKLQKLILYSGTVLEANESTFEHLGWL